MINHKQELEELLAFFETAKYPDTPFFLNKYLEVHNVESLIRKSVGDIETFKGPEPVLDSLFRHLRELKEICLKEK